MKPYKINTSYACLCMTCEEDIAVGEPVWWVAGVGVWHEDCEEPRNLATYTIEAERKRRSPDY